VLHTFAQVTEAPSAVVYASPGEAREDACAIFATFYQDMLDLTPHAVPQLVADLGDAKHGLVQAALAAGDDRLFDDANDLVAYVGSSGFATTGNPMGAPVQALRADCS